MALYPLSYRATMPPGGSGGHAAGRTSASGSPGYLQPTILLETRSGVPVMDERNAAAEPNPAWRWRSARGGLPSHMTLICTAFLRGARGIRTHKPRQGLTVFKTAAHPNVSGSRARYLYSAAGERSRTEWDSNPRGSRATYRFSKPAQSADYATRPCEHDCGRK